MPNSGVFDWLCERLEQDTSLERLEARGTVRLALRTAGLEAAGLSPAEMQVVVQRVLPAELVVRGVADVEGLCREWVRGLAGLDIAPDGDSPAPAFRRVADV